jgi:hypothetical protein
VVSNSTTNLSLSFQVAQRPTSFLCHTWSLPSARTSATVNPTRDETANVYTHQYPTVCHFQVFVATCDLCVERRRVIRRGSRRAPSSLDGELGAVGDNDHGGWLDPGAVRRRRWPQIGRLLRLERQPDRQSGHRAHATLLLSHDRRAGKESARVFRLPPQGHR